MPVARALSPSGRPRSRPTSTDARGGAGNTLSKLVRLLTLALSPRSFGYSGGVVGALIAQAFVTVKLSTIGGRMMGSVFKQDRSGFVSLVKESVGYMGLLGIFEQVSVSTFLAA